MALTDSEHAMPAVKEAHHINGKAQQTQLRADRPLTGSVCPSCQSHISDTDAPPTQLTVPPIRLIPVERVGEILGFKTSAVLELAARGELPKKIKFGTSRRASARWVEHEIYEYAWTLAANREQVDDAKTAPDALPETNCNLSWQPQADKTAITPAFGRSAPKSSGRGK